MRPTIFNDPVFRAAAEDRKFKTVTSKEWREKGGRVGKNGRFNKGFARGRRKVGDPNEKSGPVKVLMAHGVPIAGKAVCTIKLNESKDNLAQKLERLGLNNRKVDRIAVCESEPKGADHGVMACGLALPGDPAHLNPSDVVAEAILPAARQAADSIFE